MLNIVAGVAPPGIEGGNEYLVDGGREFGTRLQAVRRVILKGIYWRPSPRLEVNHGRQSE
jgi:hypothetical protein